MATDLLMLPHHGAYTGFLALRKGNMGSLSRLVGLAKQKELARIGMTACKRLNEPFPHTLLYGRGGTGKTAFARAIANDLGYLFIEKEAASLRSRLDIIELLIEANISAVELGQTLLLFLDEIHRLTSRQQEVFYFPMAEWKVDKGDHDWYMMQPFTLIGATTQMSRLDTNSFISRFGNVWEVDRYDTLFIRQMLMLKFDEYGVGYTIGLLNRIAVVCHGIPRTASQFAMKLRNHVIANNRHILIEEDVDRVFELEGIK